MKCLYCNGKMEKTKSSYKIPAYVCTKCKEKLFEETEVEAIQKLIRHLESDVRQLQRV